MAGVPVLLEGVLWDEANKRGYKVAISGDLSRTDRQIGGGPMPPGQGPVDPGFGKPLPPDMIWGGSGQPFPPGGGSPGGPGNPPGIWGGGNEPFPTPPIYLPPEQVPPGMKPPQTPPPGTVTPVPPPAGSAGWPVSSMVAPEYVVFNYPGYGPVVVTPPPHAEPAA